MYIYFQLVRLVVLTQTREYGSRHTLFYIQHIAFGNGTFIQHLPCFEIWLQLVKCMSMRCLKTEHISTEKISPCTEKRRETTVMFLLLQSVTMKNAVSTWISNAYVLEKKAVKPGWSCISNSYTNIIYLHIHNMCVESFHLPLWTKLPQYCTKVGACPSPTAISFISLFFSACLCTHMPPY